jgi:tetratricopeptide (TPR) repeat protein
MIGVTQGSRLMPVSKKPRRKKSNPQPIKDTSTVMTLPDRRAMEGFMSAVGGRRASDATAKAQEVMYDAWDQTSPRARVALAHKALAISPLCADAYVLLAEEEAKSAEEALEYYRKGVEAGEKALGTEGFRQFAGHFWGFLETRPYMRARAGLAATLSTLGEVGAAISNYQDMLGLNPNDNQGIRYVLAACLMRSGDTEALKKLLKQYDEDGSALWLYTQALVAFRENDARDKRAEELAKSAWSANSHVPAALAGKKKVKPSTNGYITMGGEDEAAQYVEEWGFDWLTTPGAVDWLTKVAAEMASTRTDRRPVN